MRKSLALWQELQNSQGIVRCLEGSAHLAWAHAPPERTARLLGAAEAMREAIQWPLAPADLSDYAVVPAARAALGEEAFMVAWAEGRAMSREQAVSYALGVERAFASTSDEITSEKLADFPLPSAR